MADTAKLFIDCRNELGEGPIWHPDRAELLWFNIVSGTFNKANAAGDVLDKWSFDEPVAAAAIIDKNNVLIATASKLTSFNLNTGAQTDFMPLEADNPNTRSNDSRVNPAGGFWIGTMGMNGESGLGAVYQYREGTLETLMINISIPNSTCFSPDGTIAYWTDTPTQIIKKCQIDPKTGLPVGPWEDHIDTSDHRGHPDGSVVDSAGYLWSARWGGNCVVRHAPDGSIDRVIELPVSNVTCPAFGGPDLKTLYITTARHGLSDDDLAKQPTAGGVFAIDVDVPGLPETPVKL